MRSLDATATQLAGTDGATFPFWSLTAVRWGSCGQQPKRIDLAGGSVQTLVASVVARGGAWGRNGVILFARMR